MPLIGVVTGLKSEIASLRPVWRGAAFAFFAAGGSAARAEDAARRMAAGGVALLMSVGVAGGLDPGALCGDVVLARSVKGPDGRAYPADAAWHARLAAAFSTGVRWSDAALLGSDRAILGVADKAALFRQTGAAAVDMESHGVARAAAALNVPFVALRAIADPAGCAIPSSAMAGMAADGSTRALAVLARLSLRPWEIPAIARLARDSRRAHAALGRVALAVGGVLVG